MSCFQNRPLPEGGGDIDPFITYPQLGAHYGLPFTRKGVRLLIKLGKFPPATRLSANRIGWRRSELERHLASLPTAER